MFAIVKYNYLLTKNRSLAAYTSYFMEKLKFETLWTFFYAPLGLITFSIYEVFVNTIALGKVMRGSKKTLTAAAEG